MLPSLARPRLYSAASRQRVARALWLTAVFSFLYGEAFGQQEPTFNSLRTPTSPAFTILGVSPSVVEKPNDPSTFAFAILNNFSEYNRLPSDFALEAAPYWWTSHSTLTWNKDVTRSPLEALARTFTFSIATAEIGTDELPVTGVALGMRAQLFSGEMTAESQASFNAATTSLTLVGRVFEKHRRERMAPYDVARDLAVQRHQAALSNENGLRATLQPGDPQLAIAAAATADAMANVTSTTAVHQSQLTAANAAVIVDPAFLSEAHTLIDSVSLLSARDGFVLELATAVSGGAPDGIARRLQLDAVGAWLTAAYTADIITVVALGRWLHYRPGAGEDSYDAGARLLLTPAQFGISGEALLRWFEGASDGPHVRWTLNLDYRLAAGNWLNIAFGKDVDENAEESLIARAGISVNITTERYAH